jgi:hypothetical protein
MIAPFNLIIANHVQETSFLPSYYESFGKVLPCPVAYTFEVLEVDKNRIKKLRVKKMDETQEK